MLKSRNTAPANKREYISDLGKILVDENGKRKYYKPDEVKQAHKKSKWHDKVDFSWAMCTFSSNIDFGKYHAETEETYDYSEMKTEMLSGLSVSSSANWTEIPDIDIDASWLDFGDVFGGVFDGIGDFIGGIFE